MKKILALLLVLLMVTSIVLVACQKKKPARDDDNNDDYNNVVTTDAASETEPLESDTFIPSGTWREVTGVVYAGVDNLNLRTAPQTGSSTIAKKVNAGQKLNRTETNGVWSKVTLDGDSTVYYVANTWLSTNGNNFSFTACDPVNLTINATDRSVVFFTSPFDNEDNDLYLDNAVCASGIKTQNVIGDYTLKKLATSVNGAWIKVEFVGTIKINDKNQKTFDSSAPGVLYIKALSVSRGDIVDPTYTPNDNTGRG